MLLCKSNRPEMLLQLASHDFGNLNFNAKLLKLLATLSRLGPSLSLCVCVCVCVCACVCVFSTLHCNAHTSTHTHTYIHALSLLSYIFYHYENNSFVCTMVYVCVLPMCVCVCVYMCVYRFCSCPISEVQCCGGVLQVSEYQTQGLS